jgi:DNA-directed RNA polymerase subunit RPC12/RpoP
MTDQDAAAEGTVSSPSYPCAGCGARVEFAPGTNVLRCPYCGHEQEVAAAGRQVQEHDYAEYAALAAAKPRAAVGAHVFVCQQCGAKTQSDALSDRCQFCGASLIADANAGDQIAPEAVLPFAIDHNGVRAALRRWVSSRWFAPSSLKKVTEAESLKGTYLPHWTYDSRTVSQYQGQRGEYYYVTETYSTMVNGKSETRTRQVRRTRWYDASGTVRRDFDDLLVVATGQLTGPQLEKLEPWPLAQAVPYQPDYLAGHQALRYDVEPDSGLMTAKERMAPVIQKDCQHDIGGDEQRVTSVDTRYSNIACKLMLLPVWIVCYLYAGHTFQVMVNGRTGEVIGQRPYSKSKIAAAVLAGLVVLAVIIVAIARSRGR